MRAFVHGVRGSRPTPGPDHVRYGGNTSCVAIAGDDDVPDLILDAGTGIAGVTRRLRGAPFSGAILLTHLHWDHVHGLPFFAGADRPDARVQLCIPEQGDTPEILARSMSPPHFPITPHQLRGDWSFRGLPEGRHAVERYRVTAKEVPHKGGRTFGYRVDDGSSTIAYVSDHWPAMLGPGERGHGPVHPDIVELVSGSDLLFHDAQYTAAEWHQRRDLGHSTVEYAVELAEAAGVGRLVLHHHDPSHDDQFLDEVAAVWETERILLAREGVVLDSTRHVSGAAL